MIARILSSTGFRKALPDPAVRLLAMHSPSIHLGCFQAIDELAVRVESATGGSYGPQEFHLASDRLLLGPLAEALVMKAGLRKYGHNLVVSGRSSRDRLFGKVLRAQDRGFAAKDGTGVLSVARAGQFAGLEQVNRFVLALGQAVQRAGMPDGAIALVRHVGGELIDNIGEHAGGGGMDAFAAFEVSTRHCWLTFADCGRGVLNGYLDAASTGTVVPADAAEALDWAVLQHRSRTGDVERGLGFQRLQLVLRRMDASVRVRSDDVSLEIEGQGEAGEWLSREQVGLSGFVVSAGLAW